MVDRYRYHFTIGQPTIRSDERYIEYTRLCEIGIEIKGPRPIPVVDIGGIRRHTNGRHHRIAAVRIAGRGQEIKILTFVHTLAANSRKGPAPDSHC